MANRPADSLLSGFTDEELLERFRRGKHDVFGTLIRRYERELYGYLRRYLGESELAEDVFQNTFLQVYLKANQFEKGRMVRPWLYAIATNQAVDALRKAGRQSVTSLDQATPNNDSGTSLVELLQSREPGPLDRAEGEECRQIVRSAVDQLPEGLRQVLILAYYQGLKYAEIAEVLDIPLGTVKSRLHSALVKLYTVWSGNQSVHS